MFLIFSRSSLNVHSDVLIFMTGDKTKCPGKTQSPRKRKKSKVSSDERTDNKTPLFTCHSYKQWCWRMWVSPTCWLRTPPKPRTSWVMCRWHAVWENPTGEELGQLQRFWWMQSEGPSVAAGWCRCCVERVHHYQSEQSLIKACKVSFEKDVQRRWTDLQTLKLTN